MTIILCGLPKCGKTSVGRLTAERLNVPFLDTDVLIEEAYFRRYSHPWLCKKICQYHGEAFFREMETEQICTLEEFKGIVSLGGGALSKHENVQSLQKLGSLVYLQLSPKESWRRISQGEILAFLTSEDSENAFYEIAKNRIKLFEAHACHLIEAEGITIDSISKKLVTYMTNGQ